MSKLIFSVMCVMLLGIIQVRAQFEVETTRVNDELYYSVKCETDSVLIPAFSVSNGGSYSIGGNILHTLGCSFVWTDHYGNSIVKFSICEWELKGCSPIELLIKRQEIVDSRELKNYNSQYLPFLENNFLVLRKENCTESFSINDDGFSLTETLTSFYKD